MFKTINVGFPSAVTGVKGFCRGKLCNINLDALRSEGKEPASREALAKAVILFNAGNKSVSIDCGIEGRKVLNGWGPYISNRQTHLDAFDLSSQDDIDLIHNRTGKIVTATQESIDFPDGTRHTIITYTVSSKK